MHYAKRVNKVLSVLVAVALSLGGLALANRTQAFSGPKKFKEQFNYLYLHPDHRASFWIINWGGENGQVVRNEGLTGPATSAELIRDEESGDNFLRTTVGPAAEPGFFTLVDVAEERTGFPDDIENEWLPEVGHPVVMEARVRWSEGINQYGGTGVGTSGVWLWNSPFDFTQPTPPDFLGTQTGFGFNWSQTNTVGGYLDGLAFSVIYNSQPVYVIRPTQYVNMQEWVDLKMEMTVDETGTYYTQGWINGEDLGKHVIPFQVMKLSTEIWHDNQHPIIDWSTGQFTLLFEQPTQPQTFDLDFYQVEQK